MAKRKTYGEVFEQLMALFGESMADFEASERAFHKQLADSGEWFEQSGVGMPHVI